MADQRIKAIHDAAALLFIRQGYAKTQISHIAKAIGVSVGTIYHDFNGKQEIMHFVLKCTIDPGFIERDFEKPITDALFLGLEEEILTAFEQSGNDFSKPLESNLENYSFEDLISDAFDLLSRYAVGFLFIEKNYFDFEYLTQYYKTYRTKFFTTMNKYIHRFIKKGILRPLKHVELTTNLIIELLAWWAMDMRYISFEAQNTPLELAKEICMDNLTAAYKQNNG